MASVTWSGTYGGETCGTGDRTCTVSGTSIPSTATINSVSVTLKMSAEGYSSSKLWRVSYFKSGSYYFIGNGDTGNYPYTTSMSTYKENIYFDFTKNLSFFAGKSSCSLTGRANTSHSSKSYMWEISLSISYTNVITPTAPTINIPVANTTTYNTKPWFNFKANADTSKLYWRVDSGTWQSFNASNGTSYAKQWTTALSTGSHTVYCYAQSSTSTNSSTVSRAFTVGEPQSAVKAGDLFDDATIDGLQANINNVRKYYNLGTYTFTTCNNGTLALDDHIDQLETALSSCPHFSDIADVNAGNSIAIANVNNVRTALLNS